MCVLCSSSFAEFRVWWCMYLKLHFQVLMRVQRHSRGSLARARRPAGRLAAAGCFAARYGALFMCVCALSRAGISENKLVIIIITRSQIKAIKSSRGQ